MIVRPEAPGRPRETCDGTGVRVAPPAPRTLLQQKHFWPHCFWLHGGLCKTLSYNVAQARGTPCSNRHVSQVHFALCSRYTRAQICGAFLVVVGVMTAVAPMKYFAWWTDRAALVGQVAAGKAPEAQYVLACVACFAFPALASIIKVE